MSELSNIDTQSWERHGDKRQRIANLTSNILNPFLVSLVVILLFSFSSTATTSEAVKWAMISIAVSVLPVFLVIVYLVRKGRLDTILTNAREQRTRIYLTSGFSAIAGYYFLNYLGAPLILISGFAAVLSTAVIFMLINLWWKISVHTGAMAASSIVLVMLYGWVAAVAVALVPLTAWSRIELEQHSLAQAVCGAILAALIAGIIFYPVITA